MIHSKSSEEGFTGALGRDQRIVVGGKLEELEETGIGLLSPF